MSYDNLSSVFQNILILYSNVQLCAFKHRNSPFEIFFSKYGFDIGLMDLHQILLQICFGSIKMMGTREVLVPCSEQFHLCIKVGLMRPAVHLVFFYYYYIQHFFFTN